MSELSYANWYSKLLFEKAFRKQHFIPLPQSFVERGLLQLIEWLRFPTAAESYTISKPVFIIGLPRSGTTVLYNLICAHESAAYVTTAMNSCIDTLRAIEWLRRKFALNIRGERFFGDSLEVDFGSPSEPIMFWGKWFGRKPEELFWPDISPNTFSPQKRQVVRKDIHKIISCFPNPHGRRFICKYPLAQAELRLLNDIFPDARFIHIVRDARMTANSLIKLNRVSNDQLRKIRHPLLNSIVTYPRVKDLGRYIKDWGVEDIRTTANVWNDTINTFRRQKPYLNHVMDIRYEDLIQSPQAIMKDVFQFCELSGPRSVSYSKELSQIGKVKHKNQYDNFEFVEEACKDNLAFYGYV